MKHPMYRAVVFALYQISLAVGIALLPIALLARHAGVRLRVGRFVERLGAAYDDVAEP